MTLAHVTLVERVFGLGVHYAKVSANETLNPKPLNAKTFYSRPCESEPGTPVSAYSNSKDLDGTARAYNV